MSVKPGKPDLRSPVGLMKEMNLLLASLRRVEVRIEPQTITDFLKWKNRMMEYNGGRLPEGIAAPDERTESLSHYVIGGMLEACLPTPREAFPAIKLCIRGLGVSLSSAARKRNQLPRRSIPPDWTGVQT